MKRFFLATTGVLFFSQAGFAQEWVCHAKCGWVNDSILVPLATRGLVQGVGADPVTAFAQAEEACAKKFREDWKAKAVLIRALATDKSVEWVEATIPDSCLAY